jgi:hypothetical protein
MVTTIFGGTMPCVIRLVISVTVVTLTPGRGSAQTVISLGAGVGTVRASDGPAFAAITMSPALRHTTAALFATVQTAVAALPDGDWNIQMNGDLWFNVRARRASGAALAASFAGSALPHNAQAGSFALLAEAFGSTGTQGAAIAAGPVLGALTGSDAVAAARVRARWWKQSAALQLALAAEPTALRGDWFTDVSGSATVERSRLMATLALTGRLTSDGRSSGAGGLFAAWRLVDRWTLEASASGFLPDPFLGFPRAWTVGAGARVQLGPLPARLTRPITAAWNGDSIVVRVRVHALAGVALAGEWNDWTPVALRRVRADLWEGRVALAPGTYRFSLVLDRTRWLVPADVTTVPDDFGGTAGLLVVPPRPARSRR